MASAAKQRSSAMPNSNAGVRYVRRNFDEAAILAVATKLAFEEDPVFSETDMATIAAMQRAHPSAGDSYEEMGAWLSAMSAEQIDGVISNAKGVLHEMEFVRAENEDGDAIYAALFGASNHRGYDVQFTDAETGAVWEAQLKATDQQAHVQAWVDAHPDGEILITSELAEKMGVPSSGIANEAVTARTEDLVDRLMRASDEDTLWDYFPALSVISVSLVVWELLQRYRQGQITLGRFKWMAAKATGLKAAKLALLTAAMMVPGLNVVTGAALVSYLLYSGVTMFRAPGVTSASDAAQRGTPLAVAGSVDPGRTAP
jgi:hypothetical protein